MHLPKSSLNKISFIKIFFKFGFRLMSRSISGLLTTSKFNRNISPLLLPMTLLGSCCALRFTSLSMVLSTSLSNTWCSSGWMGIVAVWLVLSTGSVDLVSFCSSLLKDMKLSGIVAVWSVFSTGSVDLVSVCSSLLKDMKLSGIVAVWSVFSTGSADLVSFCSSLLKDLKLSVELVTEFISSWLTAWRSDLFSSLLSKIVLPLISNIGIKTTTTTYNSIFVVMLGFLEIWIQYLTKTLPKRFCCACAFCSWW